MSGSGSTAGGAPAVDGASGSLPASFPCTQCGSPVPPNAPFCLACGTPVSSRTRAVALGGGAGGSGAGSAADPAGWRPTPVVPPLAAETLVAANYGRRVLAYLIDGAFTTVLTLIVIAIVSAAGGFTSSRPGAIAIEGWSFIVVVAGALLYPLAELLMQAFLGYTFGKKLLGLRVVRFDTFQSPGIVRMIIRTAVVAAASLVLAVGRLVVYLSALWDPSGLLRGWHDRLAKTWVIDVARGPNPLRIGAGAITGAPASATPPPATPSPASPSPATPPPAAEALAPPVVATAEQVAVISSVPGFAAPESADGDLGNLGAPGDLDDNSGDLDDIDSTRLNDPQRPAVAPASGAEAPLVADRAPSPVAFRFDTGERVALDRAGVLGRDPLSPTGDPDALLIRVPGDGSSVSKTHLDVDPTPWLADRGSTNGTRLVRNGVTTLLAPGERVPLLAGDTVRVGTRSFTVEVSAE